MSTDSLRYSPPTPPRNQRFCLTGVSWLLNTGEGMHDEKISSMYFFFYAKGLPNGDVGVATGTQYFRRYSRELVSRTGDIVKKKLGGLP